MSAVLATKPDFESPQLATRHDVASLRHELRHEVRLLKLDTDHRCAMVVFAFCMLVALAPG